ACITVRRRRETDDWRMIDRKRFREGEAESSAVSAGKGLEGPPEARTTSPVSVTQRRLKNSRIAASQSRARNYPQWVLYYPQWVYVQIPSAKLLLAANRKRLGADLRSHTRV